MDQWIASTSQFWLSLQQFFVALPQPRLLAVFLILFLWSTALAIALLRLARRQKELEIALTEIKTEVDRLHLADERRTLVELRSNECFLTEIALGPVNNTPVAIDEGESRENTYHSVRQKLPAMR